MEVFREDVAYQRFQVSRPIFDKQSQLNEATTRLRLIDSILFEVLHWPRDFVETERYCRTEGYADYVFILNDRPALVLEAKKTDRTFVIPQRTLQNRPYLFGLLARECRPAADALQQAIGYAATIGARYIAISNGHQWLFAMTFVADQSLDERLVYIFESLDAISLRFRMFCACFSQSGLSENAVSRDLLDTLKQPAPIKLSSKIPAYPVAASRNVFQNELSYILDYVWQTLNQEENTPSFLENCYVEPESHIDIITLVKELLEKRKTEDGILTQYEVLSIERLPKELAHLPSERPFVILGDVGRGKTSFLKYLRFVAAKEILRNYIQIDLNFIDRPDSTSVIPEYIYGEIDRQLRDIYLIDINENSFVRGVLNLELQWLKRTPEASVYVNDIQRYREFELKKIQDWMTDRHQYLTRVFHHLKRGRNRSIAIFFDNLDRRESDLQEAAFLKASAMARDWSSFVLICLRPDTYYRSQQNGVLDTIAPIAFTVGQPDLSLVLKRRFEYAKSIAEGRELDQSLIRGAPSRDISLDLPKVAKIFESCEFAARKRHGIVPVLEAVSNGNIRQLLDLARRILSSGHLDTKKILGLIETTGNYTIPDFEGIKTLLYGDYMQYDPSRSPFINMLDIRHSDLAEHFLRLALLHYLSKTSIDPDVTLGYVKESDLMGYLSSLCYSHALILESIEYLIYKHCVEGHILAESTHRSSRLLRITPLGRFHIFSLLPIFQYIDAIIIDTPIIDEKVRAEIGDSYQINERLLRTEVFLGYLDDSSKAIKDGELLAEWRRVVALARENITEIRLRVNS